MTDEQLKAEVMKRLVYHRESGTFRRKAGFPGVTPGLVLGSNDASVTMQTMIMGKRYMLSALVWLMEKGVLPRYNLTHLNGIKTDNRIENLAVKKIQDAMMRIEKRFEKQRRREAEQRRRAAQPKTKRKRNPAYEAAYRRANPDVYREAQRKHYKTNKQRDRYKAQRTCRAMVNRVLRDCKRDRVGSTWDMLGYSSKEFKQHIESMFDDWMTWANHGSWHVDHIVPVSVFVKHGVTDPAMINALANLQPLAASVNISKGNSVING